MILWHQNIFNFAWWCILTVYMLNLFIDKWIYFCISHQLLTLTNRRLLRFMPKEDKNIHKSPHNLYHVKLELPLKISHSYIKWSDIFFLYPPTNEVVRGYIGFTPSVHLSVHLSVCPSVSPTSRIRSVAPTVLVGSISYLYILSSNFRRCAACKVSCKI